MIEAVRVLIEHGVQPRHIILLSLFSTPHGMSADHHPPIYTYTIPSFTVHCSGSKPYHYPSCAYDMCVHTTSVHITNRLIWQETIDLILYVLKSWFLCIQSFFLKISKPFQELKKCTLKLCSVPQGAKSIIQEFPDITILTTEVHPVAPTHFGQRYFGTD